MKLFLIGLLLCFPFVSFCVTRGVAAISFDRNCEGRLKRAADANTVDLAKQELRAAIGYLERVGATNGYTSIFYNTPDEDVGFWFGNLKASLAELESLPASATPMERSNLLMKLRETLLDHKEKGTVVTAPEGISVSPANSAMFSFGLASIAAAVAGLFAVYASVE